MALEQRFWKYVEPAASLAWHRRQKESCHRSSL